MCGIIGLFIKNPELECQLGAWVAPMLVQMSERGPDSAGIAVYRDPVGEGAAKLTVVRRFPGKVLPRQRSVEGLSLGFDLLSHLSS